PYTNSHHAECTNLLMSGLGAALVAALIYRPHSLPGETPAPVFPPRRIVSLNLVADEILLALVPPERIAALTFLADDPRYSNVVAQARSIPHKVQANAEQVIALQPDLIIMAVYVSASAKTLLRETGVPFLELQHYTSLAGVQQNILAVGQTIGESDRAQALVREMSQRLQKLQQQMAGAPRPRALYYAPGGFVAGSETSMDDIITHAGGHNVAAEAGIRYSKKISHETLIALNPAAILVSGEQGREGLRELLLADPTLQDVAAIRTRQVHVLPLAYVSTLSHHIMKCVEAIARVLHPEVFPAVEDHG
ncbi:MAG: ABC transporter substrate-binding protein, partial [Candidatus Binatia bacterium]